MQQQVHRHQLELLRGDLRFYDSRDRFLRDSERLAIAASMVVPTGATAHIVRYGATRVSVGLARLPAGTSYGFWSGGGGQFMAQSWASANRGGLIEHTLVGRGIYWVQKYTGQNQMTGALWSWASRNYARAAAEAGRPVHSFVYKGRDFVEKIYFRIEKPILERAGIKINENILNRAGEAAGHVLRN
jgi:hypothetical protein